MQMRLVPGVPREWINEHTNNDSLSVCEQVDVVVLGTGRLGGIILNIFWSVSARRCAREINPLKINGTERLIIFGNEILVAAAAS